MSPSPSPKMNSPPRSTVAKAAAAKLQSAGCRGDDRSFESVCRRTWNADAHGCCGTHVSGAGDTRHQYSCRDHQRNQDLRPDRSQPMRRCGPGRAFRFSTRQSDVFAAAGWMCVQRTFATFRHRCCQSGIDGRHYFATGQHGKHCRERYHGRHRPVTSDA